jgi:hypothetical protein
VKPNFIIDYKLIAKREDFQSEEYPENTQIALSQKSFDWLKKYMNLPGKNPSKQIEEELKNFNLGKSLKLYRGLGWQYDELNKLKTFSSYPFQLNDSIVVNHSRVSSWTTDVSVAEDFATTMGDFWVVLEYSAHPGEILIDTRVLSDEILSKLYGVRQYEILLKKGKQKCKIIEIGYKEKDDLKTGWDDFDLKVTAQIETSMKSLCKNLRTSVPCIFGVSRDFGFTGITFRDKQTMLFVIQTGKGFTLKYEQKSQRLLRTLKEKNFSDAEKLIEMLNNTTKMKLFLDLR